MSEFGGGNSEVSESTEVNETPPEETGGESSEATQEAATEEANESGGFEDTENPESSDSNENTEDMDSEDEDDESHDVGFQDDEDLENTDSRSTDPESSEEDDITDSDENKVGFDETDDEENEDHETGGDEKNDGKSEKDTSDDRKDAKEGSDVKDENPEDDTIENELEEDENFEEEEDPGELEDYPGDEKDSESGKENTERKEDAKEVSDKTSEDSETDPDGKKDGNPDENASDGSKEAKEASDEEKEKTETDADGKTESNPEDDVIEDHQEAKNLSDVTKEDPEDDATENELEEEEDFEEEDPGELEDYTDDAKGRESENENTERKEEAKEASDVTQEDTETDGNGKTEGKSEENATEGNREAGEASDVTREDTETGDGNTEGKSEENATEDNREAREASDGTQEDSESDADGNTEGKSEGKATEGNQETKEVSDATQEDSETDADGSTEGKSEGDTIDKGDQNEEDDLNDEEDPGELEDYSKDSDSKENNDKTKETEDATADKDQKETQLEETVNEEAAKEAKDAVSEDANKLAQDEANPVESKNQKLIESQPENGAQDKGSGDVSNEKEQKDAVAETDSETEQDNDSKFDDDLNDELDESEEYRDQGEPENYDDEKPVDPVSDTKDEQEASCETDADDKVSKTAEESEKEDAYRTAMNNMADYLNSHNYGREDYAEYSKDPEWQKLNADLQRSLGMEVTTDVPETAAVSPESGKEVSSTELPDNCVVVNASDIDMTYAQGMDSDQFWNHHGNTKEDYMRVAEKLPDVQQALDSGKSIDELKNDPELGETVRAYYDPDNMIKVEQQPNGTYSFTDDGRHRIAAAQECGYQIPVEVTNLPEQANTSNEVEAKPDGKEPTVDVQDGMNKPPENSEADQETPPVESEFGGYSLNVADAKDDPSWVKASEIKERLHSIGESDTADKLDEAIGKVTSGEGEASQELITSLKEAGNKLVESGDPKMVECGNSLLNMADEKTAALKEDKQDGNQFNGLTTEQGVEGPSEAPNPDDLNRKHDIGNETRENLGSFEQSKWDNLSQVEKEQAVEKLRDSIAEDLQLENKPNIAYYYKESPGDFGGYAASTNTIYINRFNMDNAGETADTIAHESRHCWQHERAENPQTEQDYRFKENFDDYVRPEDDFYEYQNQPVEADARDYAQSIKEIIPVQDDIDTIDLVDYTDDDIDTIDLIDYTDDDIDTIDLVDYTDDDIDTIDVVDNTDNDIDVIADSINEIDTETVNSKTIDSNNLPDDFESKEKFVPVSKDVKKSLEGSGLTEAKINEIRNLQKPNKPDPNTYLNPDYIKKHLEPYEKTGCFRIQKTDPTDPKDTYGGTVGPPGGGFVTSGEDMKKAVQESGGDIRKLEKILGLKSGELGNNPTIISFNDPKNLRIPDGNEKGASRQKFIPGGFTCGNQSEAVIDQAHKGEYKVTKLNNPNIIDWIDKRGEK